MDDPFFCSFAVAGTVLPAPLRDTNSIYSFRNSWRRICLVVAATHCVTFLHVTNTLYYLLAYLLTYVLTYLHTYLLLKSNQINSWFSAPPTTRTTTHYIVKLVGSLELATVGSLKEECFQAVLTCLLVSVCGPVNMAVCVWSVADVTCPTAADRSATWCHKRRDCRRGVCCVYVSQDEAGARYHHLTQLHSDSTIHVDGSLCSQLTDIQWYSSNWNSNWYWNDWYQWNSYWN